MKVKSYCLNTIRFYVNQKLLPRLDVSKWVEDLAQSVTNIYDLF